MYFKKKFKIRGTLAGNIVWQYFAKCHTTLTVFANIEVFELDKFSVIWKIKFLQK